MSMATTITVDAVIGIKKNFQKFPNDYVARCIKVACAQATSDGLSTPEGVTDQDDIQIIYDEAVLSFARHLLVVDLFAEYDGVTQASTMQNSQTITDKTTNDMYLAKYNNYLNKYSNSNNKQGGVTFYGN